MEVFSKVKSGKMSKGAGDDKPQASRIYTKLKVKSMQCFCRLLERHPHFNFRMNILQTVMQRVAYQEVETRKLCSGVIKGILRKDDNGLLEFKLDILKELHKVLKSKPHEHMEPNLLDCLVLHEIMVDEGKARAIDESTKKSQQLHDQLTKLRKKGKYQEYREMKQTLLGELKETDAIGIDIGKVSQMNNEIIKETLAIYFETLKQQNTSPLLRAVFLGLPQFTQYVNIEIIWDLISVLREYFKVELNQAKTVNKASMSISNILAGLLCAFQILDVGAGTAFNVDEKDFINALYAVIQRLYEQPRHPSTETKDFMAFLKCMDIVFCQRKQFSAETTNAFVKRLALFQMHLSPAPQAAVLYLIKQIVHKYSTARSAMLDFEDDSVGGGFGITPTTALYRGDLNDPQLANAGQTQGVFELLHTYKYWVDHPNHKNSVNFRLVKSIL